RRTLARFPSGIGTDSLRLLLTAAALAGGWGWTQAPAAVLMGWAGVLSRWALQRPIRASRRQLEKMPEDVAVIGCDGLEQVAPLDAVVRGLRLRVRSEEHTSELQSREK